MIEFNHVSKTYSNGTVALHDINLHIHKGEFVFIIGASGAGKSTLLKLMMCEEKPNSGTLRIGDFHLESMRNRDIPKLRRTMGIVFQDFRLLPQMTVYDNVAFAMRVIGEREKEVSKQVPLVLSMVGLAGKANCLPKEISGGERQRVALARALANNAELILADEPTGNVDPQMSIDLIKLLMEWNKRGKTIVVVTHEHSLVRKFTYRTVKIDNGRIAEDIPARGAYAQKTESHKNLNPLPEQAESIEASQEKAQEDDELVNLAYIKNFPINRVNDVDIKFMENRLRTDNAAGGNKE